MLGQARNVPHSAHRTALYLIRIDQGVPGPWAIPSSLPPSARRDPLRWPTRQNWTKEPPCSTHSYMGNKPDQTAPQPDDTGERERLSPSAFMRDLRPEHYSDTAVRTNYELHPELLEYHLDTITNRNQTHEFEIFCRKLCERVVCPNLRPQTGPEGGGDSKADSESYPVADEVSRLTYVGAPNGGAERWAFAFSAKAKWAERIRNDVKHLADTKRAYDRVICVTSRFARALGPGLAGAAGGGSRSRALRDPRLDLAAQELICPGEGATRAGTVRSKTSRRTAVRIDAGGRSQGGPRYGGTAKPEGQS